MEVFANLCFSVSVRQEKKKSYVKTNLSNYLYQNTKDTVSPFFVLAILLLSDIVYKEAAGGSNL